MYPQPQGTPGSPDPNSFSDLRSRLRPMGVGDILDETFQLYRANFGLFVATVAVVQVISAVLTIVLGVIFVASTLGSLTSFAQTYSTDPNAALNEFGSIAGGLITYGLLIFLISTILTALQNAALAVSISNRYLGRTTSVGEAYRVSFARLGSLVAAQLWIIVRAILAVIAYFIILAIVAGVLGPRLSALLGIVSGLFFIYFGISWALTTQVVMLDNMGGFAATGRSRSLVRGYWWKSFGVILVTVVLVWIIKLILSRITGTVSSGSGIVVSGIVNLIIGVLLAPIQSISLTLLFYDLKIRKEAFDLEAMVGQLSSSPSSSSYISSQQL